MGTQNREWTVVSLGKPNVKRKKHAVEALPEWPSIGLSSMDGQNRKWTVVSLVN